jgi:hypothetical protein
VIIFVFLPNNNLIILGILGNDGDNGCDLYVGIGDSLSKS